MEDCSILKISVCIVLFSFSKVSTQDVILMLRKSFCLRTLKIIAFNSNQLESSTGRGND